MVTSAPTSGPAFDDREIALIVGDGREAVLAGGM